jgi:hypothetical protein
MARRADLAPRLPTARWLVLAAKAVGVGVADGLGSVGGAGFGEDVVDVGLDGGEADDKSAGDLGVAAPGSDQRQDLGLARGELVGQRPGGDGVRGGPEGRPRCSRRWIRLIMDLFPSSSAAAVLAGGQRTPAAVMAGALVPES